MVANVYSAMSYEWVLLVIKEFLSQAKWATGTVARTGALAVDVITSPSWFAFRLCKEVVTEIKDKDGLSVCLTLAVGMGGVSPVATVAGLAKAIGASNTLAVAAGAAFVCVTSFFLNCMNEINTQMSAKPFYYWVSEIFPPEPSDRTLPVDLPRNHHL